MKREKRNSIPAWVKKRASCNNRKYGETVQILEELSINTVCKNAVCPNIYECFSKNYATFMILGNSCTRDCLFCGVNPAASEAPCPVDKSEPDRIARAAETLGMEYAVITSPTRDDLTDGGAGQFADTAKSIRNLNPAIKIEFLIPDFRGDFSSLKKVIEASPDVLSHNMETVKELYKSIRPSADYQLSLSILREIKKSGLKTKSGFMLGLGEKESEVFDLMLDIKNTGCDYLVIGQYLKPSKKALDVKEFVHPDIFRKYCETGKEMGFRNVFAGIFHRSSYLAEQLIIKNEKNTYSHRPD